MIRYLLTLFCLLSISAQAAPKIIIVYPHPNQQIALVDSEFVFGSVTPGSKLTINGVNVKVYKEGGWLAFLDVSSGMFNFHIVAKAAGESTIVDLPISVGTPESTSPISKFMPISPLPSNKALYFVGDPIEFSFMAPPGGMSWFSLEKHDRVSMLESPANFSSVQSSVFGAVQADTSHLRDRIRYTGYYRFTGADTGVHSIVYGFKPPDNNSKDSTIQHLDSLITVLPEFPPLIGMLTGTNHIVRTGPLLGYKLLYQPPGILVNIVGMRDYFYKIKLAQDVFGYINVDSVTIQPPGTIVPEGKITFITVDSTKDGIEISTSAGVKLPYEINESMSPYQLDIDFYGAVSNVDWIRYNTKNPLVKIVRWSQPQEKVFRLTVEIGNKKLWGYKAWYEDNKFVLRIREEPPAQTANAGSLKGMRIIIDPGHSKDPGAIGPTGLEEADANLWISQELKKRLEKRGAKVRMTRNGHEDLALYARTQFAESLKADLLVSIHNNSLPDGINPYYNHGTSVYYYHPHSKALAEAVHDAMLDGTELPDHGYYYGNLALTRYTLSPAILVECTFMILPDQESALRTKKFQQKIADSITKGIVNYLKQPE